MPLYFIETRSVGADRWQRRGVQHECTHSKARATARRHLRLNRNDQIRALTSYSKQSVSLDKAPPIRYQGYIVLYRHFAQFDGVLPLSYECIARDARDAIRKFGADKRRAQYTIVDVQPTKK